MRASTRPRPSSTWASIMAAGLKKQVDAGQMTKEAALAEFGRRANSMTYDKGAGYLFGTSMTASP